jgi:universal stress protein E
MKRFKNILYIIDDQSIKHQHIADKVAQIARINGAKVTTMIVSEMSFVDQITRRLSGRLNEVIEVMLEEQRDKLGDFTSDQRWSGISVDTHIAEEAGFIGIIQKVIKDKHDLVIKEENLSRGIDQLAMRLVRKCPSPVWVIKRTSSDFKRILGAIDVAADHPETERLNKKVIELTHSLAQRENGEAHYLHVWRLEHESMLRSPRFKVSAEEISEMKKNLYDERWNRLQTLLQEIHVDAKDSHVHMVEGKIVDTINNLIDKIDIDVLVMGSLGRSGIPGLFIGNKAETLLNSIDCTVLTVKPDGFISPVQVA